MKPDYQRGPVTLFNADCRDVLPTLDIADLSLTDPPYGIGADRGQASRAGFQHVNALAPSKDYGFTDWDRRPSREAFDAIRAASREQVIFGGNYFADLLPPSPSWLVWDKDNGTNKYADFELAWTSHKTAARKIRWRWHGMLQEPGLPKDTRVHPTQKPVGLMVWIIERFTKLNDLVLDPYIGSGTTAVACIETDRRCIGIEAHRPYFDLCVRRIDAALDQGRLPFPAN